MLRIADGITEQLRAARAAGSTEALVVGLVGSVGAGKSTFTQVLKLLLLVLQQQRVAIVLEIWRHVCS